MTVTDILTTCAVVIFRVTETLTLTLKMTTARVVETSVTVNNNSPIQDYVHPDDQTQPTFEMTPGFKPFTISQMCERKFDQRFVQRVVWSRLTSSLQI